MIPPVKSSISVDLRGIASAEVDLTPEQHDLLKALVAEYRKAGQASTFILGQVFISHHVPKLRFYVTPRKLGVQVNRTFTKFFEKEK